MKGRDAHESPQEETKAPGAEFTPVLGSVSWRTWQRKEKRPLWSSIHELTASTSGSLAKMGSVPALLAFVLSP